ncbi:MAG TPA: hypothetical protein VMU94_11370, partial [Streptosporangiaceae bacterium]|nr:hypothetical protein [Streptosporangiaceae bacterium]
MNHPYRTSSDQQRSRGADVCTCCERPWARIAATGASASAGSQATCRDCHDHGSMAMQRDRAHIDLWRSLSRFEQRQHDAEVSRLGIQISQMEEELRDRPEKIVERYVGQDEIDEANEEAQRAFRSRENAFRALCEVRLIHREGEPGRCRCGQRLDTCKMAA